MTTPSAPQPESGSDWFARSGSSSALGEEYEAKGVPGHAYFVWVKSHHYLRVLRERHGDLRRLSCLDNGCGTGETTTYFAGHFARLVGADYSAGMLQKAADRGLNEVTWVACASESVPLETASFDTVALFNMIHHLDDEPKLRGTFREARRLLRPGGTLAIYDLNPINPLTRRIVLTNEIDAAVHLEGWRRGLLPSTFFVSELSKLLREEGLDVWRRDYLCFFPSPLKVLLPLERLLAWLPLGGLYAVFAEPR